MLKARSLLLLLAAVALATACGSAEESGQEAAAAEIIQAAQRSLDDRRSGRIEFALTATAEGSDPVGFEIEGDYAFPEAEELAVLDLTYRQVLGDESQETQVVSDGDEAWIVTDGEATKLTDEQARRLEVGAGEASPAVPVMDLGAWLLGGEVERSGARETVTGEVDASALISDLQRIAAQVAGVSGGELDEEAAAQIDRSVASSSMELVAERDSLRAVHAAVDFGASVPAALREALGSYAGARLELSMTVDDVETPLQVRTPDSADSN